MLTRAFQTPDTDAVIALWEACKLVRPWNDPRGDIQTKMTTQPELFLVGELDGTIVASAMVGFDGHRGWIHYLAVEPALQRQGLGKQLMAEVEKLLIERGCNKLSLQVRSENDKVLGFYRGLGYGEDQVISMGKRLIL